MLGGIAYVVVHGLRTISSMQELSHQLEAVFALPMAIGELYAAVWLLSNRKQKMSHFKTNSTSLSKSMMLF